MNSLTYLRREQDTQLDTFYCEISEVTDDIRNYNTLLASMPQYRIFSRFYLQVKRHILWTRLKALAKEAELLGKGMIP